MNTSPLPTGDLLIEFRSSITEALETLSQEEACGEIADTLLDKLGDTYFTTINSDGDIKFLSSSFWREVHAFIAAAEETNPLIKPKNLAEAQTNEYILAEELQRVGRSPKKASQVIIQMRLRKEINQSRATCKKKVSYILSSGGSQMGGVVKTRVIPKNTPSKL